ncbi:MAG: endonuclease/exonuclease/phosphatase family protein [Bacteroidota bacterium]
MGKRIRGLFRFIAWSFLLFIAVLSLGIFLAPWLPLSILPWVQVLSPLLPSLSVIYALTLLAFLLRKEWIRALVPAFFLLFSYLIFQQNVRPPSVPQSGDSPYKVLTYNLGAFEFNKRKVAKVLDLVNEIEPDLIAFQEFRNVEFEDEGRAIHYFSEALNLPHYQFIHLPSHVHGVAVFSRYPIVKLDTLFLPTEEVNSGMITTIDGPDGLFGLGTLHMSSYQIGTTLRRKRTFLGRLKNLTKQIKKVLYLQEEKYDQIFAVLDSYPHPYILAGDFNAPSHSRMSRRFRAKLADAYLEKGSGDGWTFPFRRGKNGSWGMRLDYMYHSPKFEVLECKRVAKVISDHFPLLGTFRLKGQP